MGNCIVVQEKVVKVMKTDGKVLEYKSPIKVHQVLSQFSGHVISNSLHQVIDNQNLQPDDDMLGGKIYYLLPILPVVQPPKPATKKKVKFADVEEKTMPKIEAAVRIKLVISKKELQALLMSTEGEGGLITVDHIAKERGHVNCIR
ncbi:hypothetical protein HAX54_001137 [Datura stramonium]|uniref:Uncharacterized protein n=1 Tax=Datura stramonium TaxID=4076 RepID=A0ABS8RSR2_DATST|nr:hypothetical protein [Datura stramonium]